MTNVAAEAAVTDAVNVSQLQSEAAKSNAMGTNAAAALGGGAAYNSTTGAISAPSYSVGGTTVRTVADAVTNLDGRTTQNTTNITSVSASVTNLSTQINNGEVGLVRQDVTTGNISVASDMGGDTVDMGGTAGPRTLTGVANGTQNTDAVTIAQLKAVGLVDPNGQTLAALVYDNLSLGHATLGGTNGTVIGNLVDGRIAANSMDAVNGGQLFTLQTQYDQLNVRVGNLDGRVNNLADLTNPALSASGKNSTAAGLGADASGENSTALGTDSSATGSNSVALGHGSVADRDNSVSMGSVGNERQVTNVAAATAATDAVNLGQVNNLLAQGMAQTMQQANDYTDQRFDQAAHAINSVARNAYAGIAAAMAMPNMTPSGPGRTIVAAGAGNYKNGSAVAAGATYRSQNSKWLMNAAVSVTSTGDAGVRAQVGYEFYIRNKKESQETASRFPGERWVARSCR
ncbi:YadA family autotransporter adhesin [Paraburkholderia metrosideri]|uniref:YadA family autotransporter adhesin n=1 Tax=Paraburkholderia metrosideri TaxID=580937 RepID=UPI001F2DD91F|nr:YadA-like family protein [Paraburkholderia metrosideri]